MEQVPYLEATELGHEKHSHFVPGKAAHLLRVEAVLAEDPDLIPAFMLGISQLLVTLAPGGSDTSGLWESVLTCTQPPHRHT